MIGDARLKPLDPHRTHLLAALIDPDDPDTGAEVLALTPAALVPATYNALTDPTDPTDS